MVEVVPLRFGIAFKKAFSDPFVFSEFARDILDIELSFSRVEQEHGFHPPVGKVDVRFDLFAEDDTHRAIVELQHVRESDAFDRFHYYHLVALLEQVSSAKQYRPARTVYTIVVLTRLPREERLRFDMASQSSDLHTVEGKALGVFAHKMVFVNPRAVSEKTPERVRRWLALFEDTLDERVDEASYTREAERRVVSAIRTSELSPEEMRILLDEADWEETKGDARAEGRAEGLREGEARGKAEGLRAAIEAVCELLQIAPSEGQRARLAGLDVEGLEQVLAHIKAQRSWPA